MYMKSSLVQCRGVWTVGSMHSDYLSNSPSNITRIEAVISDMNSSCDGATLPHAVANL